MTDIEKIVNKKIILKTIQWLAPYVLTSNLVTSAFKFSDINNLLFVRDKQRVNKNYEKIYTEEGLYDYNESYTGIGVDPQTSMIYFFGKPYENSDGSYSRITELYKLGVLDEEKSANIYKLYENLEGTNYTSMKELNGSEILGTPELSIQEKVNPDVNSQYQFIIRYQDDLKYFKIEDSEENKRVTYAWTSIVLSICAIILSWRKGITGFNYVEELKKIEEEYGVQILDRKSKKI